MAKLPLDKMATELEDIANDITGGSGRKKIYAWDRMADAITDIAGAAGIPAPSKKYSTKKALVGDMLEALADQDFTIGAPREMENEILAGTISVYTNPTARVVGPNTFGNRSTLTYVEMPKCETVGPVAFQNCSNLQTVSFPECTSIGPFAFNSCSSLSEISFPNCKTIDVSAFAGCTSLSEAYFPECVSITGVFAFASTALTSANFPKCTFVSTNAFSGCSQLSEISFPMLETIGAGAFAGTALTSVCFSMCTSIQQDAFQSCSSLTYVDFPAVTSYVFFGNNIPLKHIKMNALNAMPGGGAYERYSSTLETGEFAECKTVGSRAFNTCGKLQTVSFPKCEIVHSNAFFSCESLQYINMPECKTLGTGLPAFGFCSSLSYISFPKCESIQDRCFANCSALQSAYFLTSSIPIMQSTDTFFNTPISGTGIGHIYVKVSLASAFKSATNWSAYSSKIVGLTDEEIAALDANN